MADVKHHEGCAIEYPHWHDFQYGGPTGVIRKDHGWGNPLNNYPWCVAPTRNSAKSNPLAAGKVKVVIRPCEDIGWVNPDYDNEFLRRENLHLRLVASQALLALKALHFEADLGLPKDDPQVREALSRGEDAMQALEALK